MVAPSTGERVARSSLPRGRKLTFEEHLNVEGSADEEATVSPIDIEFRGMEAEATSESDLWWLAAAYSQDIERSQPEDQDYKLPLPMGIALLLQDNGHVESIVLCTYRRVLIIRIRRAISRFQSKELELDKHDDLARLLYSELRVEHKKIQLVGFHAALQSLHIHRATSLHTRLVDLSASTSEEESNYLGSYLPGYMRIKSSTNFADMAEEINELNESNFREPNTYVEDFNLSTYLPIAIDAVSAFWYAKKNPKSLQPATSPLLDTAFIALRDLDLGARLVAVFHAHTAMQSEMISVDFSTVKADDMSDDHVVVYNERYSNRLRPNHRQTVQLRLNDGTTVTGICRKMSGKRSWVQIIEGHRDDILGQMSEMIESNGTIFAEGKDDADRAQHQAVEFWYKVLAEKVDRDQQQALDPSGLFYPLFYGEEALTKGTHRKHRKFGPLHPDNRYTVIENSKLDPAQQDAATALAGPLRSADDRIVLIHGPPGTGKTTVIATMCRQWCAWVKENEDNGDLPVRAARIADPQTKPKDWDSEDHPLLAEQTQRVMNLREPPRDSRRDRQRARERELDALEASSNGNGSANGEGDEGGDDARAKELRPIKEEVKLTPEDVIPSCWIVCQSNAAVKNVAESLKKQDVPFRILVSDGYYEEWHAHMYTTMFDELIITKSLAAGLPYSRERFARCPIVLSTISGLSSGRLEEGRVFEMRPIYALLVDEASQIVLGAYPHLLARHAETLGRLGFFGDHKQLAPHGHDTIPGIESAFELSHLRNSSILLDRCYRLPRGLASFISDGVYESRLQAAGPDQPLQATVRFFDIDSGREDKRANSFVNESEAAAMRDFIEAHFDDHTLDFRVIVPYTGQRDYVENMLKTAALPWKDRVFTIDSFQGQESETVIISLVRDGMDMDGHTQGFLSNERRTNVLLSRTKKHMYIFSSRRFLEGKGSDTLVGQLAELVGESGWRSHEELAAGNGLL